MQREQKQQQKQQLAVLSFHGAVLPSMNTRETRFIIFHEDFNVGESTEIRSQVEREVVIGFCHMRD